MSYYNVIFTILPPLVIGIFDQFVSARMLDRYPQLYQLGQQNYYFTPITFFYWVGNAFYHSVVGFQQGHAKSGFVRLFVLGVPQ
jgi:phospholipid-transporting ATPase